ncbi:hypothetical protein HYX12_04750, partial [Candidatus Woesearchaeota archaeon]|nr:hypothetical protein [Candidatus Woesearchaeota archaeon]
NGEWVEIYNGGTKILDIGGLILRDQYYEDELVIGENNVLDEDLVILYPHQYLVIFRNGDSDFALNNEGYEEVWLMYDDVVLDKFSYSGSTSGMSWSNVQGFTYLTQPTPGEDNAITENCDWLLQLDLNNSIYKSKDLSFNISVKRFYGLAQNITVKGKIENINGETIREYSPWSNQWIESEQNKVYSPNLPDGIYQIKFWIENLSCSDDDQKDNEVTQMLAINPEYQHFTSSVSI